MNLPLSHANDGHSDKSLNILPELSNLYCGLPDSPTSGFTVSVANTLPPVQNAIA